jgi:hypothetical protein
MRYAGRHQKVWHGIILTRYTCRVRRYEQDRRHGQWAQMCGKVMRTGVDEGEDVDNLEQWKTLILTSVLT